METLDSTVVLWVHIEHELVTNRAMIKFVLS